MTYGDRRLDWLRNLHTQGLVMKKNPNDVTFRNINALKKRVRLLEIQVSALIDVIAGLTPKVKRRKVA